MTETIEAIAAAPTADARRPEKNSATDPDREIVSIFYGEIADIFEGME